MYIFINNVVAVAACSRLASRSQAKFQTMKLSPLSAPCAAAPAQSTVSTCGSLWFSPRSGTDVNLTRTVPVAFPRHFRSKKWSQLVAAYLACQSVAGVGVFPCHFWHKTSFIPTCVKSRSLPVKKARWQNHVTNLWWVRYSRSHGSATQDGSSSQCDGPSRMTTRAQLKFLTCAAQVSDLPKDDGSTRRVTSQQWGTTRQRMTSQRLWTTQQALLTQHMMMTTQQALLTQHMMMTTREVWSTQHTIRTWQWSAQLRCMLQKVLRFPAQRSSDGSSKSKRAKTATCSGSKATEVEQSAVQPSRSRQPKKSVASSVSVVGWPSSDGSEPHRSRSGDRRQGVTSHLSRVPQQRTLQLQDKIHPCYLMSAVCSARQWPKPATRIAEAATSSKTSKAMDDRLSIFHVKKSSKTYSSRSPLFTQSWAWSQRSPWWIWETSRPRARHSAARLGKESENSYLVYA